MSHPKSTIKNPNKIDPEKHTINNKLQFSILNEDLNNSILPNDEIIKKGLKIMNEDLIFENYKKSKSLTKSTHLSNTKLIPQVIKQLTEKNFQKEAFLGQGGNAQAFKYSNKRFGISNVFKFQSDSELNKINSPIEEEAKILNFIQSFNYEDRFLNYDGLYKDEKSGRLGIQIECGESDLEIMIKERGHYELKNILFIFKSLAIDLNILEQHNIFHSDLKPSNILLIHDKLKTKYFKYKISDYGTAVLLEKNQKIINIDKIKSYTEFYVAPEIMEKNQDINPYLSDVYSLAMIIIEMMGITKETFLLSYKTHMLYPLLSKMLSYNQNNRPNYQNILEQLEAFKNIIEQSNDEIKYIEKIFRREIDQNTKVEEKIKKLFLLFDLQLKISNYKDSENTLNECINLCELSGNVLKNTYLEGQIFLKSGDLFWFFKNKPEEAKNKYLKYYEINIKIHPTDQECFEMAETYDKLGMAYVEIGNLAEAEKYYKESKQIIEKVFGENNIHLARNYNNLGHVIRQQKDFDPELLKTYFEKSLLILLSVCGYYNCETANAFNNLGVFYYKIMNNYSKAKKYFKVSLSIHKKLDHPLTSMLYHNYGDFVLNTEMEFNLAEKYFLKSLNCFKENFSDDNIKINLIYKQLAIIYFRYNQNFKEFQKYCYLLRDNSLKELPKNKNESSEISFAYELNAYYEDKIEEKEVIDLYKMALEKYPKDNVFFIEICLNFANLYYERKKNFINSQEMIKYCLNNCSELKDLKSISLLYIKYGLFLIKIKKDLEEAEKYIEKYFHEYERFFEEGHPDLATGYDIYAIYLIEIKEDYERAFIYYDLSLEYKETFLGVNHTKTAFTYLYYAQYLINIRKDTKAGQNYIEKALKIYFNLLGEKHSRTSFVKNCLDNLKNNQNWKMEVPYFLDI